MSTPTGPGDHEESATPGMDRRTFLLRTAEVGLGVAAAGLVGARLLQHPARPWDRSAFPPVGRSRVAVLRATSYDRDLEAVVADGLRQVGADVRTLNPGAVVGTPVGNATFTFANGNSATFAYMVNGVSQVKTITREIFRAPGTVCQ